MLAHTGDIAAGAVKTNACISCHGDNGNSVIPSFPKLAEQHASYLIRQLQDFKDGKRNAPMMAAVAADLDEQSMADIAAYYASKTISRNQHPVLFSDDDDDDTTENNAQKVKELLALGDDLYHNGNLTSKVAACTACHGANGEGNKPSAFPLIRGQHADYLLKTLTDFKKNVRTHSSDNIMHLIAKKMTEQEMQALAFYISMMR